MPLNPTEAAGVVVKLAKALGDRQSDVDLHDAYYRGDHKLRFASPQFQSYFASRYADFSDNWVSVVADAPNERLQLTGVRAAGATHADDDLWRVWSVNEGDFYSDQAMLEAILHSRAYALVWGNPDDESTPTVTFEHPSQAIVAYDPGTRKRRYGLKMWSDDGMDFATLYTPDEVWKFQRRRSDLQVVSTSSLPGGWMPREVPSEPWPLRNPMGEVPLVEWQNRPRLAGEPMSDVAGTIAMQDAVNLMWAYLLNTADFASFGQRVVMGAERPSVPILDEAGTEVGRRPMDLEKFSVDRLVWLEDPDAKIGQWPAADLGVFTNVIERQVEHLAAQTRTPHHYLIGKMANLSAEAMKTAETGLVMRAREKTETFSLAAREVFRLVALAQGNPAHAQAVAAGTVTWRDVETRSEAQLVDALQKLKDIGFPFNWLAERYGLTQPEIDRVMRMRTEEMAQLLGPEAIDMMAGDAD